MSQGGHQPAGAVPALRRWQRDALRVVDAAGENSTVLVDATPGAGKTTFALTVARDALRSRRISRVVVVAPTDHLRTQWAAAAWRFGLNLDPTLPNAQARLRAACHGYVTTYAQAAGAPSVHAGRVRTARTLVILDEVHHAGDGRTWGDAVRTAFGPAVRRLALSGTPFRTGQEQIPFISYVDDSDGGLVSRPDFGYGYREALADGVVRPVLFAAYTGEARWRNSAGEVLAGALTEGSRRNELDVWRRVLDPAGDWVPHVVAAVDQQVTALRAAGSSDAAALLLASDQDAARAYARVVTDLTGQAPVLVVSDDPGSSAKIEQFRDSTDRIMVAVRQVSEGVDVPRLMVLGYLTSYRTPLFFAQAVGRVVRARRPGEQATVFLPAVRPLLALAAELEAERDHVIRPVVDDQLDADELVAGRSRAT